MRKDACERNGIESSNGVAKRRYGLDLIVQKIVLVLFSAVSTFSRGGCGQTCGRIENAPVECGRFAVSPGAFGL